MPTLNHCVLIAALAVSMAGVAKDACTPEWLPTFVGAPSRFSDRVTALTSFDQGIGNGPALFAGGHFVEVGDVDVQFVARWDGATWSPLSDDMGSVGTDGPVLGMAGYDDGSGPALFLCGAFASGSVVRRWDGTTLGGGDSGPSGSNARGSAAITFDDGTGEALYVTGKFSSLLPGNGDANSIARWDGTSWSALGEGLLHSNFDEGGLALAVFDDGGGPALYVGGEFCCADGELARGLARWDGTSWSSVPGASMLSGTQVNALAVFDDGLGAGPQLNVGGDFTPSGGFPYRNIARWDGTTWSSLQAGLNDRVESLTVFDDGTGPGLYVGGLFTKPIGQPGTRRIAKWDGLTFSPVALGFDDGVLALAVHDTGTGPTLHAGGVFTGSGPEKMDFIARLGGDVWSPVAPAAINREVLALDMFPGGTAGEPQLHAAGRFTHAGATAAKGLARWTGTSWVEVVEIGLGAVKDMQVFDDGGGPDLFLAGDFGLADGQGVANIVSWDGSTITNVGGGVNLDLTSLAVLGPRLYTAGSFAPTGLAPPSNIFWWDGVSAGILPPTNAAVRAMTTFDDGTGEQLIISGAFTQAGAVNAQRIARWDGATWNALGAGMEDFVFALEVFDDGDGGGPALYAGGAFTTADGLTVGRIARWDGTTWSPLGSGLDGPVRTLSVVDHGGGPVLVAGGSFTSAGGQPAANIACWDGTAWSPIGTGTDGIVRALLPVPEGSGHRLVVGGEFTNVGHNIAVWDCPISPWSDFGGGAAGVAGIPGLTLAGSLTESSTVDFDLVAAAPSSLAAVFLAFSSLPTPFVGGTLYPVPAAELLVLGTDGAGAIHETGIFFPGAPSGSELWFQVLIEDGTALPFGVALSNAVRGLVP